jgi:hypothetical protein
LCLSAWEEELGDDFDREFILNGVEHGFDIIDPSATPSLAKQDNHPSAASSSPLFQKAHMQVLTEIERGNYAPATIDPLIISPMGVIPKPDGGVRLIHDCSRPQGEAVNDYVAELEKQRFQSVDDAAKLVTPGCFMAKVDLQSAYRSVKISAHSQQVTGLRWLFPDGVRTFYDRKLPFGSKVAPSIFHRLSQAVRRIMSRKGFTIVAYLDDFFICELSQERCILALNTLISLLRKLGFSISWKKVVDPSNSVVFLGIELNSVEMALRLPADRLSSLHAELAEFAGRTRASKRQLQSLTGKLNWAAQVIHGGRVFLRRIINAFSSLKHSAHKVRLHGSLMHDISWWQQFMAEFNGKSLLRDKRPVTTIYTDACVEGAAGHWGDDWFYLNWEQDLPHAHAFHINEKETLAVVAATLRWAPQLQNKRVIFMSDNTVTVGCINKGSSKNHVLMQYLRVLFWVSAKHNIHLTSRHIRGVHNTNADTISRLHEPQAWYKLLTGETGAVNIDWSAHMSQASVRCLFDRHVTPGIDQFPGCGGGQL